MFSGKKKTGTGSTKELTKRDVIAEQIEKLNSGQTFSYITSGWSSAHLIVIELNPRYPKKGKKYLVSIEELADGKPSGQRQLVGDSNKPGDVAGWITESKGELFSGAS